MTFTFRQRLSVILGLLLIGGLGYSSFLVGAAVIQFFATLDSAIAAAIIAAAATVLVSVFSVVLGKAYEAQLVAQKEIRDKKVPVYEDLIKFIFTLSMGSKKEAALTEQDVLKFAERFTPSMMVWGADEVLAAWVKFRKFSVDGEAVKASPMKLMFLYEDVALAIRRDLGHRNRGIAPGDVLALFVNDIAKYLSKKDS